MQHIIRPFQPDEYFFYCVFSSFHPVVSLPLAEEDAVQQDGPELHHRVLLQKCSGL